MPVIKKILNYSVVLVEGENQKESIVLSKGIGFGKKPGDPIELQADSQVYLPVTNLDGKQLLELLDSIPAEYLQATRDIVEYAEQVLGAPLNEHIYLALTDHLHFAVKRLEENLIFASKMFWELKTFYPTEYAIGERALEIAKEHTHIRLPDEEAANIAFHIINARKEAHKGYDAMKAVKLIKDVVSLVSFTIHIQLNQESIHYTRFITHMQFFAERFLTGRLLDAGDDFLYRQMEAGYPVSMACAEKIRTLILKTYHTVLPNEEVAYLAVHIERLTSRE